MSETLILKVFEDIENVKQSITDELDISVLEGCALTMQVSCEDTAKHALSMAMQSRKLEQTLEKSRIEITRPHLDYQRAVNKLAKDFQKKLEAMQYSLEKKIHAWMQEQDSNPFTKVDELRVEDGTLYRQETWDFVIEDESLLPLEHMTPNPASIKESIKNGVRNIPGVKITREEKIVMRVKN